MKSYTHSSWLLARAASVVAVISGIVASAAQAATGPDAPGPATAEVSQLQNLFDSKPIDITDVDFSVPESPALAALGSSSTKATQPATPKELVTRLLQGTDANGNIQSGVALDFVPYLLLGGNSVTLAEYNAHSGFNWQRTLSNIQLSVATVKDASAGSNAVRIASGLRYVILDLGDPRTKHDLVPCFMKIKPDISQAQTAADLDAIYKAFPTAKTTVDAYQACFAQSKKDNWNRSSLDVGVAPSWTSTSGSLSDLSGSTVAYYLNADYGFERIPGLSRYTQLLGHFQSTIHDVVPQTTTTPSYLQDTRTYGLKLRVCADCTDKGAAKTYLALEADRIEQRAAAGHPSSSYRQFSISGEHRIASGLYLNLQFGGTTKHPGQADTNGNRFLLGGFKWSLDNAPQAASQSASEFARKIAPAPTSPSP